MGQGKSTTSNFPEKEAKARTVFTNWLTANEDRMAVEAFGDYRGQGKREIQKRLVSNMDIIFTLSPLSNELALTADPDTMAPMLVWCGMLLEKFYNQRFWEELLVEHIDCPVRYNRRRRLINQLNERKRVSRAMLSVLTELKQVTQTKIKKGENCAICRCRLGEGKKLVFTSCCGHQFHHFCIRKVLGGNNRCPLCRAQMTEGPVSKTNGCACARCQGLTGNRGPDPMQMLELARQLFGPNTSFVMSQLSPGPAVNLSRIEQNQ